MTTLTSRSSWDLADPEVLVIPPQAHTFAGFLDWVLSDEFPQKVRVTFLDGDVRVDMNDEAIRTHAAVKTAVYGTLIPLVTARDWGELFTDGVLLCNQEANVSTNPDGVGLSWLARQADRVRFVTRQGRQRAIEGAPDWVMEIVSDSSVAKDLHLLRDAYHRARIPEYWLIDARGENISFRILLWRKGGYVAAATKDGWTASKAFGRSFRLTRRKNRCGEWSYTLEVR